MLDAEDDRAGAYLELLKEDLTLLRDLATIFFLFTAIVVIARTLVEWTGREPHSDPD